MRCIPPKMVFKHFRGKVEKLVIAAMVGGWTVIRDGGRW